MKTKINMIEMLYQKISRCFIIKGVLPCLAICFFLNYYTQLQAERKSISLPEIWSLAEKNSPGLKARLKEIDAIQHSIEALPRLYVPNTYFDAGYSLARNKDTFEHGPLARLRAEWTFWDGGRNTYARSSAKYKAESARFRQKMLIVELKKSIAELYYQVSRLQENSIVEPDRIKNLQRLARLLLPRLKIGKNGYSDLEHVKLEIAKYKSKMNMNNKLLELKVQQLKMLSGIIDNQKRFDINIISNVLPEDDKTPENIDFKSLPAYKYGISHIKSLEERMELAKRNLYWPTFGVEFYGGYGPYLDAINPHKPEVGASLKFNFPLFLSRSRTSQLAAEKGNIEAMKLDIKQYLLNASVDYKQKQEKIILYKTRMEDLKKIQTQAQSAINVAYNEFARGLKSSADMLAIIQYLYDCKDEYLTLKMEWLNMCAEKHLLYVYSR